MALDTTNILGRGAVKDTYNLLADGIVKLARALAQLKGINVGQWAKSQGYHRYLGSSVKGEAAIDWFDRQARAALLAGIVADADRLLELPRQAQGELPEDSAERQRIVAAAELLGQLLLQDVERTEGPTAATAPTAPPEPTAMPEPTPTIAPAVTPRPMATGRAAPATTSAATPRPANTPEPTPAPTEAPYPAAPGIVDPSNHGWPREVETSEGRITLEGPPQRILTYSLGHDEMVIALVAPERIAAIGKFATNDSYSNITEQASELPIFEKGAENVLAANPDLFIVSKFTKQGIVDLVREAGVPVVRPALENSADGNIPNILLMGYMVRNGRAGP